MEYNFNIPPRFVAMRPGSTCPNYVTVSIQLGPCALAFSPARVDNSDYFAYNKYSIHINYSYSLIFTAFYMFEGNYHILLKILFFSLIIVPSFFSFPICKPFTLLISFSGYTIFYKYPFKTTVPRTEHSAPDGIWPWQNVLGQFISLIYRQHRLLQQEITPNNSVSMSCYCLHSTFSVIQVFRKFFTSACY